LFQTLNSDLLGQRVSTVNRPWTKSNQLFAPKIQQERVASCLFGRANQLDPSRSTSSPCPRTSKTPDDRAAQQINVIQIVLSLIASWVSDALPKSRRWPILVFAALSGIIICTSLATTAVYPHHRAQRWALYCE
jgi:hypothetical protein